MKIKDATKEIEAIGKILEIVAPFDYDERVRIVEYAWFWAHDKKTLPVVEPQVTP